MVLVVCVAVLQFLPLSGAHSAVGINRQINFQGKVVNGNGTNVANGSYSFVFGIYIGASGGVPVWTETQTLTVTDGVFQANLGAVTSLPGSVDFNTDNLYLGMNFNGDGEMSPRIRFSSVPQAFNSERLGGMTASQFVQLSPGSQQTGGINVSGSVQGGTATFSGANALTLGSTTNAASIIMQDGTVNNRTVTMNLVGLTASYAMTLPTSGPGLSQCLAGGASTASQLTWVACATGTYLAKNAVDTSGAAVTAGNYLYSLSNTSTGVQSGVLSVNNGSNTGSGIYVTSSADPASGQALLLAVKTNNNATGNLLDLQSGATPTSKFSVSSAGNLTVAGTYNSNTFTSSQLTFGAASGATVSSAASQSLTVTGVNGLNLQATAGDVDISGAAADSGISVSAGTGGVQIQAAASTAIDIGTNDVAAKTINIGSVGTSTRGSSIHIADSTGNIAQNIAIGSSTNSGSTLTMKAGAAQLLMTTNGTIAKTTINNTTTFQIQNAAGTPDVLFRADTTNNQIVVGNSTASAAADTTLLVVDSYTGTNVGTGVNGAIAYDATNNAFKCGVNNAWVTCANSGGLTLQGAYDGGNTIATPTTGAARDVAITLSDSSGTDSSMTVNAASGSTGKFATQYNGADTFSITNATNAQGSATFRNATNNAAAFQIQNAAAQSLFTVDTTDSNITVLGNNSGATSSWSSDADTLPVALTNHSQITANGYIYVVGGQDASSNIHNTVFYTKVNSDGTIGAWKCQGASNATSSCGMTPTNGNALPATRRDPTLMVYNGFLYAVAGDSGAQTSTVYYAKLNADGSTGAWQTDTNAPLPAVRGGATGFSANGYAYVIGGKDTIGNRTTVFYTKIGSDGKLGAWKCQGPDATACGMTPTTTSNALPNGKLYPGSTVMNGYVYVVSGNSFGSIHYAKLSTDGSVGTWTASANPIPGSSWREAPVVTSVNGYLYVMGGFDGNTSTYTNSVLYSKVATGTGAPGAWSCQGSNSTHCGMTPTSTTNALPVGRAWAGLTGISLNGYIYMIGGWTTTPTSTVYVASTSRLRVGGSLDLVGLSGDNLNEAGTAGGALTAGDTTVVGTLDVRGAANFMQGMSVGQELTVGGSANFRNAVNSTSAFQVQTAAGTPDVLFRADTTNNRVYVGNSTASAAADTTLLVVDSYTGANVGSAVNGAMVYDATNNKFKCGVNGAWVDCDTGVVGTFLTKNSADTSSAAITASNYLYVFSNSSSGVQSGVLNLNNGANTGNTLYVTSSVDPASGQALIFASKTNNNAGGNLIDLQSGATPTSKFSVSSAGNITAAGNISVTGQYQVSGTQISSANLSNDSNLAKLNGGVIATPQSFSGVNHFTGSGDGTTYGILFKNASNSATALAVQTAGVSPTTVFGVDTLTARIGIGTAAPARRLEVVDSANPQLRLTHTAGSVYADLQVNNSGYVQLTATGARLGIGAAPQATLDVNGDAMVRGENLYIGSTGDNTNQGGLIDSDVAPYVMRFKINSDDSGYGWGWTHQVNGGGAETHAMLLQQASGRATLKVDNQVVVGPLSGAMGSTPTQTAYVKLGGNSATDTSYFNAGNVGVGNNSPGAKLDVTNTGTSPYTTLGLRLQSTFSPNGVGTTQTNAQIITTNAASVSNTIRGLAITQLDSGSLANTNIGLYIDAATGNANDTEIAAILGGRVRIGGTTNPAYPLDVTGDINSSTALRVGGTQVCTSTGCTANNAVLLQTGTPGTPQTGHLNVNGSVIGGAHVLSADFDTSNVGALTIGTSTANSITIGKAASPAQLTMRGNASSTLKIDNGTNNTTLAFVNPTADVTYQLGTAANGTYGICTTASVCTGYAAASASGAYVQLQGATPGTAQTGHINVDGTVIGGTLTSGGSIYANTSIYTGGSAAGNLRLDNSGNLTNIGNITGTGAVQISSTGGGNALSLSSGSGTIGAGSNNFTTTGNLNGAVLNASSELRLTNSTDTGGVITKTWLAANGGVSAGDAVIITQDSGSMRVTTPTVVRDTRIYGVAAATVATGNPVQVVIAGNTTVTAEGTVNVGDQLVTSGTTAGAVVADNSATVGIVGTALTSRSGVGTSAVSVMVRPVGGQNTPKVQYTNANALSVQNTGGTSVLNVDTTGSGTVTVAALLNAGTVNASTAIQTGGTQRIDASGNLSNIGNIGLTGAISGGTSYSGSGNINTTGGVLQTNSVTRVDNSGNLTNIGNISGTGAVQISSGGGGALSLDSASNVIQIAASDTTLQRAAAGNFSVNLSDASGATTLVITNSDVTQVANLSVEGGVNIGASQSYSINGTSINTSGTLSNVAYLSQANTFSAANLFNATDGANGIILKSTTSTSTQSINLVFRDNQAVPESIYVRKQGNQLYLSDNGGTVRTAIGVNASADTYFNSGGRVAINQAAANYMLDVNGGINVTTGNIYSINGASINTAGTLNNVAYLNQANVFTGTSNTFNNVVNTNGGVVTNNTNVDAGTGTVSASNHRGTSFDTASAVAMTIGATNQSQLTIGKTNSTLTLQGGASTSLSVTNAANSTTVNFALPTATVTYQFGTAAAGTYNICTSAAVCAGYVALQSGSPGTQQSGHINVNGNVLGANISASGTLQSTGNATLANSLVLADATNRRLVVGSGTPTLTTSTGGLFVTDTVEVLGRFLIGTTTNGANFDGTSKEVTFNGTARHQKTIKLTAEYAGAVLDADGAANTGTMTAAYDATQRMGYYRWTTNQASAQDYDIVITVPVPEDWAAWNGNPSFKIYESATAGTFNVTVTKTDGTTDAGFNALLMNPGAAAAWSTINSTALAASGYTAGGTMNIRIHLTAPSNQDVRIGDITLPYYSKW